MKKTLIFGGLALLVAAGVVAFIVFGGRKASRDEHEGHDHGGHAEHPSEAEAPNREASPKDEHEGHDHTAHGGHESEAEASTHAAGGDEHKGHAPGGHAERVELTPEQRKHMELELAVAGPGAIQTERTFPGETMLNPDRMVHVVPRAKGIVREVKRALGDRVEAGEILGWIESDEFAEAKLSFYAKQAEVEFGMVTLTQAREIFENTAKLMALLKKEASQEELHRLDGLEMGAYRGQLLAAYADYLSARETLGRVRSLQSKALASGQQLLEAETNHRKAREAFLAALDTTRYQTLIDYGEAVQKRQVDAFEAVAAEQRLRVMGADDEVIAKLRALVPKTASLKPCSCTDPDCRHGRLPSVVETLGKDGRFAWYAIYAPSAGFVIGKHLSLGEKVTGEESVFDIADTSSVWVRFSVYQKDLTLVKAGQAVRIELGPGAHREGNVSYVSPLIDEQTRTMQARVVLDNSGGSLRPGLYVTVHLAVVAKDEPVVISQSAVQVLDETDVVFVEDGDGYKAVPVTLGATDRERVVVTSGLRQGQRYVVRGAFDLKAKIVTSGLGAHAGHGH